MSLSLSDAIVAQLTDELVETLELADDQGAMSPGASKRDVKVVTV